MIKYGKICVFAICLICSGCGKAETSVARKDHILSGDHGWIDLTLERGTRIEGQKAGASCELSLSINGEPFLDEFIDVAKLGDNVSAIGYRFPVPAGNLQAEIGIERCVETRFSAKAPVNLAKNNLASLRFDGTKLSLQEMAPYDPPTLDRLQANILAVQSSEQSNESTLATLTRIVVAILVVNVVLALILLYRRK